MDSWVNVNITRNAQPIHTIVFSHVSDRDGAKILQRIAETLHRHDMAVDHLIVSTYHEKSEGMDETGKLAIGSHTLLDPKD